jgi:cell division protein FtsW (lipid II flippase)
MSGVVVEQENNTAAIERMQAMRAPRLLRNLELVLLLFALAISGSSVMLVEWGALGELHNTLLLPGIGLAVLVIGLHIVVRYTAPDADPLLLPIAVTLNGLGIAEIYRIDIAVDLVGWESTATRQMVWTALAIIAAGALLALLRNHLVLFRFTYLSGLLALVLLLLPMLPGIGVEQFGARVWIAIGPFSFQPGEIAKIALAIFFAGYLVRNRDTLSMVGRKFAGINFARGRDLGPILVFWMIAMAVLVFQRDLGTSLLYFGLFLVMIYVATGRTGWIVIGVGLFAAGALIASQTLEYVNARFQNWLNPFDPAVYEANRGSYQLVQGLFGLANGGMTGTGLGQGFPQDTPLAQSDYIIPSLGEELGLIGLFVVLALYLLLIARGLRIGFAAHDDFGKLLGVGLAFVLALQVFIVVGGVTRVIPLTGLTAPFLAAGGSSLLSNWLIVALFLRLSNSIRSKPKLVIR